jgi:hypothetical protein
MLEKDPLILYKYSHILNRVINSDKTGVNEDVKKGYIKVIYMGFCDCCMEAPCIKLKYHRLYKEYKEKYNEKNIDYKWNVDYIIYDKIEYTNIELAVKRYIKDTKI